MQYSYIVVEGPQDLEFVARLLRVCGLHAVHREETLDNFWHPLIPRRFPPDGDLRKRVPVPVFFQDVNHSVAVHSAGGIDRLIPTVEETLRFPGFDGQKIASIGLFLDADWDLPVQERFAQLRSEIQAAGIPAPGQPGIVSQAQPRTGVFIFPDNQTAGTLESLLDECAALVYSELRAKAQHFASEAASCSLTQDDRKEFAKPAGELKVIVGCVGNFLKPERAIQVSIADNRWVCDESLALPRIAAVHSFLKDLIGP